MIHSVLQAKYFQAKIYQPLLKHYTSHFNSTYSVKLAHKIKIPQTKTVMFKNRHICYESLLTELKTRAILVIGAQHIKGTLENKNRGMSKSPWTVLNYTSKYRSMECNIHLHARINKLLKEAIYKHDKHHLYWLSPSSPAEIKLIFWRNAMPPSSGSKSMPNKYS
jgi:hypothetical protein